jgi:hypothetical protein
MPLGILKICNFVYSPFLSSFLICFGTGKAMFTTSSVLNLGNCTIYNGKRTCEEKMKEEECTGDCLQNGYCDLNPVDCPPSMHVNVLLLVIKFNDV